jgi:hypothetical protein
MLKMFDLAIVKVTFSSIIVAKIPKAYPIFETV